MTLRRARFVLLTQQTLAVAAVSAVAVSAVGVVDLQIVTPAEGGTGTAAAPEPVTPTVTSVPISVAATGGSRLGPQSDGERRPTQPNSGTRGEEGAESREVTRVVSAPAAASGYATVGVTWDAGTGTEAPLVVEVRTRTGGTWSSWQDMHAESEHGEDGHGEHGHGEDSHDEHGHAEHGDDGSPAEHAGADGALVGQRDGTDPLVVGEVDAVQARITATGGPAPTGLSLEVIDPGEQPASTGDPAAAAPSAGGLAAATLAGGNDDGGGAPRPVIHSRADWGADERLRDPGSLRYGTIKAAFVHHTVNANAYDRDDVPSIIRGIYAYHTRSRGWSDVGYNFLVDRFGRIWEGRYGGVSRPVVGAHTLGYNEESFAMSAIGNFETHRPSEAMVDAYAALFAWKLGRHGIAADDMRQDVAGDVFPAVNGHRDAGSTACPGRYLYARIPDIRARAARIQERGAPDPPPDPEPTFGPGDPLDADVSGSRWPDLVVRDEDSGHALVVRTEGQHGFEDPVVAAEDWAGKDLVVAAGDVDRDGVDDVLARSADGGTTRLYRGEGDGTLDRTGTTFDQFSGVDQLTGVGDFDGDGVDDLVGRRASDGQLRLYRGATRAASYRSPSALADDWGDYDLTTGAGDLDGDDRPDLVARRGDVLDLVRGRGDRIAAPRELPGRWGRYDALSGRGDATGDGVPDLLVRGRSRTFVIPGDGEGGFEPRTGGWDRYAEARHLALAQLAAGARADVLRLGESGSVTVAAGTRRRNLGRVIDTGTDLQGVDLLLTVGDWDGDGRVDVMTRRDGTLQLRRGLRGGRLAAPKTVSTRWSRVSLVAAVGDLTGDGNPDLVGRARNGTDRVWPGDGDTGFRRSFALREPLRATAQVALGNWDSDGVPDTAVRRADGSLWAWSTGGNAARRVAAGLRRYDWVRGLGDLDGDGRTDLVVRSRVTGHLYLLPGRRGGFADRRLIGTGFGDYDLVG